MSQHSSNLRIILSALGLVLSMTCASVAFGQNTKSPVPYDVVKPPLCDNHKGEKVDFIERSGGRAGIAAGMAVRDSSGKPVVFRSNYDSAPPEFQRFIDRHECAHHQTGDIDRPHPPRNSADHLMNESISDCVAILRLRDEEGYDRAAFNKVSAALRFEMANIGFPEISISSRIGNIDTCYAKYGSPQDFVFGILKHRGLLLP